MTNQIQKPHYEVEDLPPHDVDTQIALFEQSAETVKGSAEAAQALYVNAEAVLGNAYHAAQQAQDAELAKQIDDVWEQVQGMITNIHRHGAVLHGSKETIAALKNQRDTILKELNGIKDAVANHDTTHALLRDFVTSLEEEWNEELMWADDMWHDNDSNDYSDVEFTLTKVVGLDTTIARKLIILLRDVEDERNLTDEQIDLLKRLALTLPDSDEVTEDESDEPLTDDDDVPWHILEDEDGDE